MQDFLKTDMNKKILYNVLLPPLNDEESELVTYKVRCIIFKKLCAVRRVDTTYPLINEYFVSTYMNS